MSKYLAVAVAVLLIASGLIASSAVPFRGKVVTAAAELETVQAQIAASCGTLETARSTNALRTAAEGCVAALTRAEASRAVVATLTSERTAVRGLFAPTLPAVAQVAGLISESTPDTAQVAQAAAALLAAEIRGHQQQLNATRQLEQVNSIADGLDRSLHDAAAAIQAISKEQGGTQERIVALANSAAPALSSAATAGAAAIQRWCDDSSAALRASLPGAADVKAANAALKTRIADLARAEQALQRVKSLGARDGAVEQTTAVLRQDATRVAGYVGSIQAAIRAQESANATVRAALSIMDQANERLGTLEANAPSSVIMEVHRLWADAVGRLENARAELRPRASDEAVTQALWTICNGRAQAAVQTVYEKAEAHRSFVEAKYVDALQEESTATGAMARGARRGLDRIASFLGRAADQAAQSRIGREVGISAKMLILGTKALYDLQNPNTDAVTWAMSYSGDVDQLMAEADEVQRMKGASITGKNTVIEDLINAAHARSFKR